MSHECCCNECQNGFIDFIQQFYKLEVNFDKRINLAELKKNKKKLTNSMCPLAQSEMELSDTHTGACGIEIHC